MRKKRKRKKPRGHKRVAKFAKLMRLDKATYHERSARYILRDICLVNNLTVKNQKTFHNKREKKWYIVDFYIPELKLVIEIDGNSHLESVVYDNVRTEFLESIGNTVVRFWNKEVEDKHFREKLLSLIKSYCK